MKKERNANVAYVATITALVEKPKRGKEKHVRYRRVHHTSDEVNEKRLQRVYKLYDEYRAEKRKQKQKEI